LCILLLVHVYYIEHKIVQNWRGKPKKSIKIQQRKALEQVETLSRMNAGTVISKRALSFRATQKLKRAVQKLKKQHRKQKKRKRKAAQKIKNSHIPKQQ